MTRWTELLRRAAADQRGAAAIEMALIGGILSMAMINVVEVWRYAHSATQVAAASQAGAHAALVKCRPTETPVTINCPTVTNFVTTAVEGGTLGANVRLKGAIAEGWYCINPETQALTYIAPPQDKPSNCADGGDPSERPSLYVRVEATYAYQPIFPGLTVVQNFTPTIDRAAWMRLR